MTQMDQTQKAKLELLEALEAKEQYLKYHKIESLFPDEGPFKRELYHKHVGFMNAGSQYSQRAIIAANRTGKTLMGAYEMTCHLTGNYPDWWEGRKFHRPIQAWAASVNNESTKNILQFELVGDLYDPGTGLIPKDLLDLKRLIRKAGVTNALETLYVKHISGGYSKLDFKSYEQGRDAFQGTKKQVIWLDEEPKEANIYSECLTRTMDKYDPGIIYCTFTPLFGLSDVVLTFLPEGKFPRGGVNPEDPYKFVAQVSWDEVPHLSEQQKTEILASYSKHEREARSKGIPSLGSGAIYPYMEDLVTVPPFEVPPWWPKAYGLDVGWNMTAAVWGAMDPDSRTLYIYSEHYGGEAHPAIHASAIRSRGEWMTGSIDPASAGANQVDGRALFDLYEEEGLILEKADNTTEAGILRVGQMFEAQQLKIFTSCTQLLAEYRVYRRDEKGKIIKKNDHGLDALRYLCMTGIDYLAYPPDEDDYFQEADNYSSDQDDITGY
jgi:phage terminase large subunit-like protein